MVCEASEYVADQGYSVFTCSTEFFGSYLSGLVYAFGIVIFVLTAVLFIMILKR